MDFALLRSLVVLALVDSTSFGTLLIPIWLLLHPGPVRPGRILIFLGTVAAFYFGIGVAVALGADAFLPQITRVLDTRPAMWTQLVAGVALFFWSFRLERRQKRSPGGGGRLLRWRERALSADRGAGGLAALALAAAAAEVTTMLPYLGAIGLLTTAALPAGQVAMIMAGYCLVMIVPALLLLVARLTAGQWVTKPLTRISDWMANSNTLSWIVGIVGFLLARDAAVRLGLLGG
ncbi:GAP family protein [Actinoplanes sp. DH11]|uniref:GAP family protein n=1 Tax=Actinoplanes sp. DH11 TaxID=2857011 RepID=UPI001E3F05B9|nr:GAP family protein [Actinoplanes sp. DH11]